MAMKMTMILPRSWEWIRRCRKSVGIWYTM